MSNEISIIGGNVSGLSAAYYLSRKGYNITIFEPQLWNKPCGGAISREFDQYLRKELNIGLEETNVYIPRMKVGLWSGRHIEVEGVFSVTTRYDLQAKLTERLQQEPTIKFIQKRVTVDDFNLFTPQTIIASGFTGFTHQILGRQWKSEDKATILRFDGVIENKSHPNAHLIVLDNKIVGYGWVFIGKDNHVNIGLGGVGNADYVRKRYYQFFDILEKKYDYQFNPEDAKPQGWGLPLPINKWKYNVSTVKNSIEFIGVGDALGLAHPILGAGIEPAWQSGWILAESVDENTGTINTTKYKHLLAKNLSLASNRRLDRFLATTMRNKFIPYKDKFGYVALRLFMNHMIDKMREYPWFALVNNGKKNTGFHIPVAYNLSEQQVPVTTSNLP